jgi:hypothetical protein
MRALGIGQRLDAHRLGDRGYANWRGHATCQVLRRLPAQDRATRHDAPALDDILQFSDITRPVMAFESRHYLIGDSVDHLALLSRKLFDKVFRQQRDIVSPFS